MPMHTRKYHDMFSKTTLMSLIKIQQVIEFHCQLHTYSEVCKFIGYLRSRDISKAN